MIRTSIYVGLILIVLTTACVDRISFDTGNAGVFPIVVEGYISNQPGPYEVRVNKAFDIESKLSIKTPIQVKKLEMSDNVGNVEQLSRITDGVYRTGINGIQGVVGRAYKIKVEFLDGRVYETIADTMRDTGTVDQIDHEIVSYVNGKGIPEYGFEMYVDSQAGENADFRFMWRTAMTYQVTTSPMDHKTACAGGQCADPLPCSGHVIDRGFVVKVAPCTCCECWVTMYDDVPIVSNNDVAKNGIFKHVKAGRLPITGLTMAYKTHVEVRQYSLSQQAYDFWKAVKSQKEAAQSLFQPVSGKITGNFIQVSGKSGPIEGIFYATSISSNAVNLTVEDVPRISMVPPIGVTLTNSCLDFKNSTNVQPSYW
jgi:hypothetical protein